MNRMTNAVRTLLLLVCLSPLLLGVPAAASAASGSALSPMRANQYTFHTPDGLAYTYQQPDGTFMLHIDAQNTRWEDVMLANASTGVLSMRFTITHPADAKYYMMETGNGFESDDSVLENWAWMETHDRAELQKASPDLWFFTPIRPGAVARFPARFAVYIPEFNSVSMEAQYEKEYCYIRWYRQDGSTLDTRKLVCQRSCTKDGLYQIDPPAAFAMQRLTGDLDGGSGMTWQAGDGEMTYTPVAPSGSVLLGVEAPADAVRWALADNAQDVRSLTDRNDKRYAGVALDVPNDGLPASFTVGVLFLDASDRVVEKGLVRVYVRKADALRHAATYSPDWQKVPKADLLITNPAQSAGYEITYEDGLLQTDMTGTGEGVADADASLIEIKVRAPQGMKGCRVKTVGACDLYGPMDPGFYQDMETPYDPAMEPIVGGVVTLWAADAFRQFTVAGQNVTVYMPPSFMEDYMYAETTLILWYASEAPADDAPPDLVQYYNRVDRRFSVTRVTDALASEDEIVQRLTQPVAVDAQGRPWRLQVRYYLQSGTNARHYELKLLDENGDFVTLPRGESITVYLPYMDGFSADDPVAYTLDHYTMDLYSGEGPASPIESNLRVERMPYGIKCTLNGFSPFVLSWRDAPTPTPTLAPTPTPRPPKTGDPSAPGLWLAALALALLGAARLMIGGRKRIKA